MAGSDKLWHNWWFWLLLIPFTAIVLSEGNLPINQPWFWGILSGIGGSLFIYWDWRNRSIGGKPTDLQALRAEVRALREKLLQRELSESIATAKRVIPTGPNARGIVVILFSDIQGFTQLVERFGDEAAHERLKHHNDVVRNALERHNGREVKHLGDGFMLSFTSAREALMCAAAIQRQIKQYDEALAIQVRIGLHAGEPIHEDSDFIGRTVIMAQRIMDQANGGQIFLSEVVKTLVGPMKGFQYVDHGLRRLEGIAEGQRLYEFHPIEALEVPVESEIGHRLETLERQAKPRQR